MEQHDTEVGAVFESACTLDLDDEEPVEERRFLTMPSDRVLIVTESLNEAMGIVRSLREPVREMPERWRGIATEPALASSLVVLREYATTDPWLNWEDDQEPLAEPYRVALWFTGADAHSATFSLHAVPADDERWALVRDYIWNPGRNTAEVRHEGHALIGGLTVDLKHSDGASTMVFVPILSFGVSIAI